MEYKDEELTGWFTGVPPERDGVYQVQTDSYGNFYAYWSAAKGWGGGDTSVNKAEKLKSRGARRDYFHTGGNRWRGINYNPDAPVKPKSKGNKRKTLYVVTAWVNRGEKLKTVGAFYELKNAQEASQRYAQPSITKIRFRTPEHN